MKIKEGQFMMLPNKSKIIGLGIIVSVIVFNEIRRNFSFPLVAENRDLIKEGSLILLILGLLIIALSKEKVEDERTKQLKVNALAGSFVFGALYAAFAPFLKNSSGEPILSATGQGLMLLLLGAHVGMLYGLKFQNWYDKKKKKHD